MSHFPAHFLVGFTTGVSVVTVVLALSGVWPAGSLWACVAALSASMIAWHVMGHRASAIARAKAAADASELASVEALDQLREDFLATLSHELRTPLNAIVGWVHLLRAEGAVDPARGFEAIERNAAQQAHLIDDLLDISSMLKGGLTMATVPTNFEEAAWAAGEQLRASASARQIEIVFKLLSANSIVIGDSTRLQQAVRNLLSNAVKFTAAGGRIEATVTRGADDVVLEVRDYGQGVDPSFLPHMFLPFRQGHSQGVRAGLGLGLSIVEEIVRKHQGSVTVRSEGRGHGTSVVMSLPLAGQTTRESRAGNSAAEAAPPDVARRLG